MLSQDQAKKQVELKNPGVTAVACASYKDLYLVRVQHADPDEQNYDPFFSVDPSTGTVKEFSVMTDGDIQEIAASFNS